MKALIFIPTLTAGGAERVAAVLANAWCGLPATQVALLLMFDDELFYPLDPRVRTTSLGLKPGLGAAARTWALARALSSFRRAVVAEQPDFVLSFMNKYNVFCLAALRGTGIPVIASERDSPTEPNLRLRWALRALLYPKAAGIITQSEESKTVVAARTGQRRIAVIPNPVPRPAPVVTPLWREKFVLSVARLVPKKGHADLIDAFARAAVPDWRLVICGEGPLKADLATRAAALGIADRVSFEGNVKDVATWYRRAGVFALPSYFEGFPNALAEAMVSGAPVVSYDCPTGPSQLIRDGCNGFLVPVGDVAGLSERLGRLMLDRELSERFSAEAARVADRLDAPVIARTYFDFCAASAERRAS